MAAHRHGEGLRKSGGASARLPRWVDQTFAAANTLSASRKFSRAWWPSASQASSLEMEPDAAPPCSKPSELSGIDPGRTGALRTAAADAYRRVQPLGKLRDYGRTVPQRRAPDARVTQIPGGLAMYAFWSNG
jgi:hypothetical protein